MPLSISKRRRKMPNFFRCKSIETLVSSMAPIFFWSLFVGWDEEVTSATLGENHIMTHPSFSYADAYCFRILACRIPPWQAIAQCWNVVCCTLDESSMLSGTRNKRSSNWVDIKLNVKGGASTERNAYVARSTTWKAINTFESEASRKQGRKTAGGGKEFTSGSCSSQNMISSSLDLEFYFDETNELNLYLHSLLLAICRASAPPHLKKPKFCLPVRQKGNSLTKGIEERPTNITTERGGQLHWARDMITYLFHSLPFFLKSTPFCKPSAISFAFNRCLFLRSFPDDLPVLHDAYFFSQTRSPWIHTIRSMQNQW